MAIPDCCCWTRPRSSNRWIFVNWTFIRTFRKTFKRLFQSTRVSGPFAFCLWVVVVVETVACSCSCLVRAVVDQLVIGDTVNFMVSSISFRMCHRYTRKIILLQLPTRRRVSSLRELIVYFNWTQTATAGWRWKLRRLIESLLGDSGLKDDNDDDTLSSLIHWSIIWWLVSLTLILNKCGGWDSPNIHWLGYNFYGHSTSIRR